MGKNNRATDPAYTNKKIKDTNMASTGRKEKLKEKTKASRVQLHSVKPGVYMCVVSM